MYRISKTFDFCAAHRLEGLPEGHQCARLHGHNYSVTVTLEHFTLDDVGFVLDYGALDFVKTYIEAGLEHRNLNEVFYLNPTAENLARFLFTEFNHHLLKMHSENILKSVTVSETPKTSATYEP